MSAAETAHETVSDWYETVPKVEIHVHLEGAIPHGALFNLIEKYGGDPQIPNAEALSERFRFRSFSQFIEAWSWKNGYLREYEDFEHIAELTARDLRCQNVVYAEMFFSPSLFVRRAGLGVQELTCAIRKGLSRVEGIEVALVADLVRNYGPEFEIGTLRALGEVRDQGVVGIGIGGTEPLFPPEPFAALFEEARGLGFHTDAHAGEAAGPESIWGAVRDLRVDRIGHGARALEDPALVDYLVEHRVPVEMCPGSNVRTEVVARIEEHPIRECFERGMLVSVNTDDPQMFGTRLADEYRALVEQCGFSREEVGRLLEMAVESTWLPVERKRALAARVRDEVRSERNRVQGSDGSE